MSLIHNERTKLTAAALDRASTACFTVGAFGPLAAFLYGVGGTVGVTRGIVLLLGAAAWMTGGALLHIVAWLYLGRLK